MATAMIPAQPGSVTLWCEPQLSERLNAAVRHATTASSVPVVGPALAAEARQALAAYEAEPPTDPEAIDRMVGKMSLGYPNAKLCPEEAAARMDLYTEMLEDIPHDILRDAFKKVVKTCRFFPSIAEIREAAAPAMNKREWRKFVLRHMIRLHETEWKPPLDPADIPSPDEIEAIKRAAGIRPPDEGREQDRVRRVQQERRRREGHPGAA